MRLTDMLARVRREPRITTLAERVADDCRPAVWRRVSHRVGAMSLATARGYTRARAAAVIHQEVEKLIAAKTKNPPAAWKLKLIELTTEAVVRMIVAQSRVVQPVAVPVRRAA